MRKIMVFGVFDKLHDGHREMLRHARKEGDYLVVVVAQDHVVQELKGHLPSEGMGDRMEKIMSEGLADEAVAGDHQTGTWKVVERHAPQAVAVGYDQQKLRADLEEFIHTTGRQIQIIEMPAYKPETHHTSKLSAKR